MLIRAFRSTRFFPVMLLVILSGALWTISYTHSYKVVEGNGMPFYDIVLRLMALLPAWAGPLLGVLLVNLQGIHLNLVLNKHEVLYKQSWLPALLYVVLASLLPAFLWLHPLLFVNTILIFALDKIFSLYKSPGPLSLAFDGAFLLSLASLFYLPAVVLGLFYFLCLLILRPFSWREWTVGILGWLLPFFLAFTWYFLNDQLLLFYEQVFISGIKREIDLRQIFNIGYSFSLAVVGLLFILSLLRLQTNYFKNVTKARLIQQLLVLMIPICLLSVLVSRDEWLFRFSPLALPLSVYLAYYFLSSRKIWISEALFLLLAGSLLYNYFGI
jgi:hypothetical protein